MDRGTPIQRSLSARAARGLAVCLVLLAGRAAPGAEPAPAAEGSAAEALASGLTAEQKAELAFLGHLGWRFVRDPSVAKITAWEGTPCYRKNLASARAAGDLLVKVPPKVEAADLAAFAASLPGLADSIASRCAYQQKVQVATGRATTRLAELERQGRYEFPQFLFWNSFVFKFRAPQPEWTRSEWSWRATHSSADAVRALLERGGVAECYSAQQVAVWAIQYELYGHAAFDEAFPASELVIGRPPDVKSTPLGSTTRDEEPYPWRALLIAEADQQKDPGLVLAGFGPKAFAGVTGILRDQKGGEESNENFTIVTVTPAVVEAFRANGGFRFFAEQCKRAWDRREAERRGTAPAEGPTYDQIMSQPVFTEFVVYVQPFGVGPVRKVIEKEMIEEGNGPVYVLLYTHGREDAFFQLYRKTWEARFLRGEAAGMGAGVPSPPAPAGPPVAPPSSPGR